ncbi:quercetin dioxygenase-like cupin family protein [Oxalobacteraceae bacterium GrIS 1.11]
MALPHAASGQLIELEREIDNTRFSAIALAKTDELELVRLTLPKGKVMPEHHVPGEITVQCLSGEVVLDAHGASQSLRAGQMVFLAGGQVHALRAEQDSVLLLTMLLVKGY